MHKTTLIKTPLTLLVLFTISIGLHAQPGYKHAPANSRSNNGDYNVQLLHLGDSAMKKIFGEFGFSRNFILTCIQNPCEKGYFYANVLESNRPCAMAPQDTCKEAILTYRYANADVPLTIKMVVSMKDAGNVVYIDNNKYGKNTVPFEKQYILSLTEIQKILADNFAKDSLALLPDERTLVYSNANSFKALKNQDPSDIYSRIKLVKETKAGEKWESGFIYTAYSNHPKLSNRSYHFDALTGNLLWITSFHKVPN
jgi:hypothetical protein